MSKHKLTEEDMKQIAHHISQRKLSSSDISGQPTRSTEQYLETYNDVMDKLEDYNSKC